MFYLQVMLRAGFCVILFLPAFCIAFGENIGRYALRQPPLFYYLTIFTYTDISWSLTLNVITLEKQRSIKFSWVIC